MLCDFVIAIKKALDKIEKVCYSIYSALPTHTNKKKGNDLL